MRKALEQFVAADAAPTLPSKLSVFRNVLRYRKDHLSIGAAERHVRPRIRLGEKLRDLEQERMNEMTALQKVVQTKSFKRKTLSMNLSRAHSYNVAPLFLTPTTACGLRGDSSGLPERPKRGLSGIDRPLFGRPSRPNAPVRSQFHHMIGNGRRISGVPKRYMNARQSAIY